MERRRYTAKQQREVLESVGTPHQPGRTCEEAEELVRPLIESGLLPRNCMSPPTAKRLSFLNKTPISCKANRKIGGEAPSKYLPRIQDERQVGLPDEQMDVLLASHAMSPELLRADAFDEFVEGRRRCLSLLIENAMGKPVSQVAESGIYEYPEEGAA